MLFFFQALPTQQPPEVVAILGATPIFVDVYFNTYNIDPNSLIESINIAKESKLKPKGIIAVDLFGQPSDYNTLEKIANKNKLWILADAAQSYGGQYFKKKVGKLAHATATSFFPAKPLGCYGDGEQFLLMMMNLQIFLGQFDFTVKESTNTTMFVLA